MTLQKPLWEQNDSYPAALDRQLLDVLFTAGGVIASGDLAVAQRGAGANMSVDVAAGRVVVPGTDVSNQGKYLCWSDAVANVVIATAPGTGLSRIDLVVAQVRDADAIGGGNNDWIIVAVTGTAAATGSQVAPAVPASAVVLAQVAVGPNVTTIITANVTDKRPFKVGQVGGNPAGRIYQITQTILANATVTQIAGMTTDYLRGGMTVSSNGLVVPVPGVYRASASISYGGPAPIGGYFAGVAKNGATIIRRWDTYESTGGVVNLVVNGDDSILLAANDVLYLYGYQATGGALGTNVVASSVYLSVDLVSG